MIVSGSNALQFFDRTFYPDSDLDVYVEKRFAFHIGLWLLHEGYKFEPGKKQLDSFKAAFATGEIPKAVGESTLLSQQEDTYSSIRGASNIFNFVKTPENGSSTKVQLITTTHAPLDVILQFHSTCVMNIFSYEKAYSLYPMATFEERRSLICPSLGPNHDTAVEKYLERGWEMLSVLTPAERCDRSSSFAQPDGYRWIGDRRCWTIRLPLDGITVPSFFRRPISVPVTDNLALNTWVLEHKTAGEPKMIFEYFSSPFLKFSYLSGSLELVSKIVTFLDLLEMLPCQDPSLFWLDAEACHLARNFHQAQELIFDVRDWMTTLTNEVSS